MPNHLRDSNSPYLLQHANNPVDWYPWGPDALEKARREDKPIFLSIGYAACHWCHVMAHESFEDAETAAFLNEHFVCVKVDREERPDLDNIYMAATQALTGSGGWPMSVFLTPDLRPFYAGTYFPPVSRYNLPSFKELLSSLAKAWREQPAEIERVSAQVLQHIKAANETSSDGKGLGRADLEAVTQALLDSYDWGYGGWGTAPKFPQPMLIEFLLRQAVDGSAHKDRAMNAANHALQAMARGGMYDVVGGGFSRYSTDNFWRVPHFEKMLYDNAQLARVYLHAWQITRNESYKRVVLSTLDFVQREMTDSSGGFFSSLDADSEGEEGKFYAWTRDEIRAAMANEQDFELFAAAYGLTERGNWEGKTVLQRVLDDASLAVKSHISADALQDVLDRSHQRLLVARSQRPRPATDDKMLTSWNGLMLQAFVEAARFLPESDRKVGYAEVATRSGSFLLDALREGGRLHRSWRRGTWGPKAFLEDHASLILGLLELYQMDQQVHWFEAAMSLAEDMARHFSDPEGGFFDTADDAGTTLLRPKELQDDATPSGNAMACEALLKLAALTGRGDYRDRAEKALQMVGNALLRFPTAFGRWLNAADFSLSPEKQIAIVYPGAEGARDLLDVVNAAYRPNAVLAASAFPPADGAPPLLMDRPLLGRKATAYVCENFVCNLPVVTPADLEKQLSS